jgi:hypothetical protein
MAMNTEWIFEGQSGSLAQRFGFSFTIIAVKQTAPSGKLVATAGLFVDCLGR